MHKEFQPISPHLHQHFLLSVILVIIVLVGVKWYLTVFWFAFPWWLMMLGSFSRTYWLFLCFYCRNAKSGSLPIFRLKKYLVVYFFIYAHIKTYNIDVYSKTYIDDISTLTSMWFENFFSSSVNFFIFLMVPFKAQKFSVLMKSNLIFSFFCSPCALHAFYKKIQLF